MRRFARPLTGSAVVLALLASAGGAGAQSLTSLRGLGYPVSSVDARTEALGGLGLGLKGLAVQFTNPASATGTRRRGAVISTASTAQDVTFGDASISNGASRFPLMGVIFPVGRIVFTAGYGGFLDQAWAVSRDGEQALDAESVTFHDQFVSTGGVGQARVGAAIPVTDHLAVGVGIGAYAGRQDLRLTRRYDSTTVGSLQSYSELRSAQYYGPTAQLGFQYDPSSDVRVSGSLTWSGTLRADSAAGNVASREYALPLQVAAGASAYLAPGLLATVSGRWSGWSATDPAGGLMDTGQNVSSRDTWEVGAGLELDDPATRSTHSFPLRIGYQYRQLPFSFAGSEAPTEWLASFGTGLRLGADFNTPLARIDLTVQRGARTAPAAAGTPGLEESMWRFVVALSIFGT